MTEPASSGQVVKKRGPDGRFLPGQSGNPGGTPEWAVKLKALASQHSEAALIKIVALMNSDDERVALAAAQEVLNRAIGKPKQEVDLANGDGSPVRFVMQILRPGEEEEA